MKLQIFIIAILVSIISWDLAFLASRDMYRASEEAGIVRNLHIKQHLEHVI